MAKLSKEDLVDRRLPCLLTSFVNPEVFIFLYCYLSLLTSLCSSDSMNKATLQVIQAHGVLHPLGYKCGELFLGRLLKVVI